MSGGCQGRGGCRREREAPEVSACAQSDALGLLSRQPRHLLPAFHAGQSALEALFEAVQVHQIAREASPCRSGQPQDTQCFEENLRERRTP